MKRREKWIIVTTIWFGIIFLVTVHCDDFYSLDHTFVFNSVRDCKNNEYYDVNYFLCKRCESSFHLAPSNDKLSCVCNAKSITKYEFDSILQRPICDPICESNKTTGCISPSPPSPPPTPPPKCNLRKLNYTIYSPNRVNVEVHQSSSCQCNLSTNALYEDYCIPQKLLHEYQLYQSFKPTSPLYKDLKFIMMFCTLVKNQTACQQLANLCVLSFYNMGRNSPCNFLYTTQTAELALNYGDKTRPFLFYRKGKFVTELLDRVVDFQYDMREKNMRNNTIKFMLVSYNLHGQLISMRPLKVMNDLNACSKLSGGIKNKVKFAQNYRESCTVNLNSWIENESVKGVQFVSLYIDFWENNHRMVKTVPVLIKNAMGSGNSGDEVEYWQLVKRFALIDFLSGQKSDNMMEGFESPSLEQRFKYIRYVKKMELRFRIHDHEKRPNRVSVPLLILEYGTYNSSHVDDDVNVQFEFKISFAKHYSFDYLLEILLPVFILLAFTMAIFQTVCYKIRQNKLFYDMEIFSNFLIFLCSIIANALFLVVVIVSLFVFFVYKSQQKVKILLPIAEQDALEIFVFAAVAFKFVKILRQFWLQVNIDIFFIDWERPKVFESMSRNYFDTPSIISGVTSKHTTIESVSAWRMYFIANEWQELITKRKISFLAHFIMLCLAFFVFGFENWSANSFKLTTIAAPPDTFENDVNIESNDRILKLAVGIIVYSTVYFAQIIYNFVFHERYIDNPIQQFVDVCSVSNISVLILCMTSYGFYIHGRSPHGFSDTDMCSMILQFRREEENMCGHRGLLPGSEQQTYTILAPSNLRSMYERLINQAKKTSVVSTISQNEYLNGERNSNYEYTSDKILASYFNINRFFSAFIDHALKDLDYVIQEKTIFESLLDCELQTYITESKGIFYIDNGHSFDKVLFYGNEFLLFLFELKLFSLVLILSNNFLLSILVVGIVYKIFGLVVQRYSKTNLAKKTLIDKRFLI